MIILIFRMYVNIEYMLDKNIKSVYNIIYEEDYGCDYKKHVASLCVIE